MTVLSCLLLGNEALLVECARILTGRGHRIAAIASRHPAVRAFAAAEGLRLETPGPGLAARLAGTEADWLLSIANLALVPPELLARARHGGVNFHDGPLPAYAGLNAPAWAILNREPRHAITWHRIGAGIDDGDILLTRSVELTAEDTAFTLNARCFAAAIETFGPLLAALETGAPPATPQDPARRRTFARDARPPAGARLDLTRPATDLAALVRALDHGGYRNPLAVPKLAAPDGRLLAVTTATPTTGPAAPPGTVLEVSPGRLVVATASTPIALAGLTDLAGAPVAPDTIARPGERLPTLTPDEAAAITAAIAAAAPHEGFWRRRLADLAPATLAEASAAGPAVWRSLPLAETTTAAAVALWAARLAGAQGCDLALATPAAAPDELTDWVPVRATAAGSATDTAAAFAAALAEATARGPFARDLPLREPGLTPLATPAIGLAVTDDAPIAGTAVTVALRPTPTLHFDAARLTPEAAARLAARLATLAEAIAAAPDADAATLPLLPPAERTQLLEAWNTTATAYAPTLCLHEAIAAQAARTPDATALVFGTTRLSYAELDARANRLAHVLAAMGAGPDVPVGLALPRGPALVVAALAILKAGAAYLPLDPAYPPARLALYLEDSGAPLVVTRSDTALPAHAAATLLIDTDPRIAAAPPTPPTTAVTAGNLAYLIYTSGSTGRPKGVMVEHRSVANFFAGMDARLAPASPPGTWLAVTSLAFDISVLELFWTLARGFTVVLAADETRTLVAGPPPASSNRPIDFSLFYWGNDDGPGPEKYRLLLEGARFADTHGFAAVWTPERHFHAFGGPYPNPAVTGAAVAAVTRSIDVRAGSCVAPLHHSARIAEEWAVIDNLTGGRAGIAIASGWQPDDFVLRPENTPPANKRAMLTAVDEIRRLWRGEAVEFPTASGSFPLVTQPRPVSRELPVWITTAGNPETWREAGALGANVLTHLLGQSITDVAERIETYHAALRAAGHDPARFTVTLMLHTFLGADRDAVRETARGPMKAYLRAAAGLIKHYAWAFPAFRRPAGVASPMQLDLGGLGEDELDAILDFAFQRYFDESGLFGTIDDGLARVAELKAIGVGEIACLIDYGIPVDTVLAGLRPLADLLRRANQPAAPAAEDNSIAAEIRRHGVTHLQCTPSMARMLVDNDEARAALGGLRHLLIGGEPLPGRLVGALAAATGARIENMYGPTETTIWSSTAPAAADEAVVNLGLPIANTRLYVLDPAGEPVPIGAPGELWIGGDGVARGYWRRPELTAERFRPDPFQPAAGARIYGTGDLVRRREDGRIDFLGRIDHQVKIRGHRIELGEIEAALVAAPGVREAVVMLREDSPGHPRLVGYVVADAAIDAAGLRGALGERLPEIMVPAAIVRLDAFPLTPNRKIDRGALPPPSSPHGTPGASPATDTERRIAAIWSRLLGVAAIGPRDSFFALGGHSLLAVQAHREIRDNLAVPQLAITDIFRFPTLAALAAHIAPAAPVAAPAAEAGAGAGADIERRRALRAARQAGSG